MKARAFFDAWAEVTVSVMCARRTPSMGERMREMSVAAISERHGARAGEDAGRMFDTLRVDNVR